MNKILPLSLCSALIVLSGCSAKYTCSEYPSGGCQPVSHVNADVNEGVHDYRADLYKKDKKKDNSNGGLSNGNVTINVAPTYRTLNYTTPGDPILTPPVVLRTLITSWEDADKDLNAGGFVYIKLRDSEWVIQ